MTDDASNEQKLKSTTPRRLRFTVNGKSCYALKWRDERTANQREINYVLREAASDEIRCLMVDAPLWNVEHPELVSVRSTGRTLARAGTTWELAVTVWEDGSTDEEGMIRFCAPDTFRDRAQYLRDDLKRVVREHRAGISRCYEPMVTRPNPTGAVDTALAQAVQALNASTEALRVAAIPRPEAKDRAPASADVTAEREVERLRAIAAKTLEDALNLVVSTYPHLSTAQLHAGRMHARGITWDEMEKALECSKSTVSALVSQFYEITTWPRTNRRMGMGKTLKLNEARDGQAPDEDVFANTPNTPNTVDNKGRERRRPC